jgi:hypothetical protein
MAQNSNHKTLTAIAAVFTLPSLEEKVAGALALAAPEAHSDIREHFQGDDKRKAMSRQDCMFEGSWGQTSQIEKEKSGALRSFLDGKKRLVSTSSFYEHLIARLILSHPVNRPAPKGTHTSSQFKPRERRSSAGGRAVTEI